MRFRRPTRPGIWEGLARSPETFSRAPVAALRGHHLLQQVCAPRRPRFPADDSDTSEYGFSVVEIVLAVAVAGAVFSPRSSFPATLPLDV